MSIVGFDFGNNSCVIALARKGAIDVIMNDCSNRQTPSCVGYTDTNRHIGEAGLAQHVSNYKNTIVNIKKLIGQSWSDEEFKAEVKELPYKVTQSEEKILVEVNYSNEKIQLSPEQITGALFTHLKILAERILEGTKISDCVVAVPHYFTDKMRRAVMDSANIAGLNVLRLMNEGTAIALQYGLLRSLPETVPVKVMFFDMGHSHTTVTLAAFIQGSLTVLGTSSLRNIGTRNFDKIIVNNICEFAKDKYKIDILSNIKATLRLSKQCEKIKKTLSANLEAPYNIECIMNDIDVKGVLTRDQFEGLSTSILEQLLVPIKDVLTTTGTELKDLDAVEILGGGSRIPMVRKVLKDFLGKELFTTCNAEESVARGCALQCAMLSPNMRVREFIVNDISPYPITVGWGDLNAAAEEESVTLFTKYNPTPSVKQIQFGKSGPFKISARYANPADLPPGLNPLIGSIVVKNLPEVPTKQKLKIKLDINGLLSLNSAQALEELNDVAASDTPMDVEADKEDNAGADDKKKKKYKRTELVCDVKLVGGLSVQEIAAGIEKEAEQATNDRVIAETAEKRNELEAFIYDTRTNLERSWAPYVKPGTLDALNKVLDEGEEWLTSDEGENSQKSVYAKKLAEYKSKFEAIAKRKNEFENRDQAVQNIRSVITKYKIQASSESKFLHISAEEKKSVLKYCDDALNALQVALAHQQGLALYDDVFISVAQIEEKKVDIEKFCEPIMSKPVPKPAAAPTPTPTPAATNPEASKPPAEEKKVDMDLD